MATLNSIVECEGWREARKLTAAVYRVTAVPFFDRDMALRDQMRRAAVSIMANLAEGFGCGRQVQFIRYARIALGSSWELLSHVYVAHDVGYLLDTNREELLARLGTVIRLINGLIRYLRHHPEP